MKANDSLYIDDESASRGLDWAMTIFVYTAALWFCVEVFKPLTLT